LLLGPPWLVRWGPYLLGILLFPELDLQSGRCFLGKLQAKPHGRRVRVRRWPQGGRGNPGRAFPSALAAVLLGGSITYRSRRSSRSYWEVTW
jgi:hypothetical protein